VCIIIVACGKPYRAEERTLDGYYRQNEARKYSRERDKNPSTSPIRRVQEGTERKSIANSRGGLRWRRVGGNTVRAPEGKEQIP